MSSAASPAHDSELFRAEVARILDSPEFAGSRHLRDFFSFTSAQALSGRRHLDQVEIAAQVLGRDHDFNPQDDAAVRKLATLTRQRLDQYYQRAGSGGPVVVTLPRRSYLPHFHPVQASGRGAAGPGRRWARRLALPLVFAAGVAVGVLAVVPVFNRPAAVPGEFAIVTGRGDVAGTAFDIPGGCLRLGPEIAASDQVRVRLRFVPEAEAHQAGILIWQGPGNFVRLGLRFYLRAHMEFGHKVGSGYSRTPENVAYEPRGQTGDPLWLSIRRTDTRFDAFISSDGLTWRRFGSTIHHHAPMPHARIGIYAFNGRREIKPALARFDRLAIGPLFYGMPEETDLAGLERWQFATDCDQPSGIGMQQSFLAFAPMKSQRPCEATWTTPAPAGDWAISTKIEHVAHATDTAGLVVFGDKGAVRLFRSDVLSFVHPWHLHLNEPDFPGSPPVTLTIRARQGRLTGSFSRDDATFRSFPLEVPLRGLGGNVRFGLRVARREGLDREPAPPAGFYHFVRHVERLDDLPDSGPPRG